MDKKNKCLHILLVHANKYNKCIKENKSMEDFLIIGTCRAGFLILIKYIYNQMLYLQELGFYVEGGSLTVKYLTESILVQDGIESKFLITLLIHSTTFQ